MCVGKGAFVRRYRTRSKEVKGGVLKILNLRVISVKILACLGSLLYLRHVKVCCDLSQTIKNGINSIIK